MSATKEQIEAAGRVIYGDVWPTLSPALMERALNAALSLSPPADRAMVEVPKEITLEMQHAYFGVIDKNMKRVETDCRFGRYDNQREAYRAMLAAALPTQPNAGEKGT